MKYLNYILLLVVSLMILVGATVEYVVKHFPTAVEFSRAFTKKLYTYISRQINRFFKSPTYSFN